MRLLVSCPTCGRQYDASGRSTGDHFHCLCSALLEVPHPEAHEAAVVRCSSCGAPREEEAAACRYCGADFTLHEKDLHTICPACMARISDRARYCHHCATPIVPEALPEEASSYTCPVCGDGQHLNSRSLGKAGLSVLECPVCGGLWLGGDTFGTLLDRARSRAASGEWTARNQAGHRLTEARFDGDEPLYRPCPMCGSLMNRQNFGRKSAIIIDSCKPHGIWFDAHELDGIIRWIREGGETTALRREREDAEEAKRQARMDRRLEPSPGGLSPDFDYPETVGGSLADFLGWIVHTFLD